MGNVTLRGCHSFSSENPIDIYCETSSRWIIAMRIVVDAKGQSHTLVLWVRRTNEDDFYRPFAAETHLIDLATGEDALLQPPAPELRQHALLFSPDAKATLWMQMDEAPAYNYHPVLTTTRINDGAPIQFLRPDEDKMEWLTLLPGLGRWAGDRIEWIPDASGNYRARLKGEPHWH
ncbi:MAG: hypothetical protein NVS3B20_16460 [Polyangiales bacterium]